MNWIAEWLPYLPSVFLSGIFNFLVAYQKFDRDLRSPFLNPWRSLGFWIWTAIQFALPALVFGLYGNLLSKPAVNDLSLYGKAIQVGFFFTVFVNADADLGFTDFPVDKYYAFLTRLAYRTIAAEQTGKLANFRADLRIELLQNPTGLQEGLDYLKDYFQSDPSFDSQEEKDERIAEIDKALAQSIDREKANAAIALILQVRRKDSPEACRRFGCSEDPFLKKYFPGR